MPRKKKTVNIGTAEVGEVPEGVVDAEVNSEGVAASKVTAKIATVVVKMASAVDVAEGVAETEMETSKTANFVLAIVESVKAGSMANVEGVAIEDTVEVTEEIISKTDTKKMGTKS